MVAAGTGSWRGPGTGQKSCQVKEECWHCSMAGESGKNNERWLIKGFLNCLKYRNKKMLSVYQEVCSTL